MQMLRTEPLDLVFAALAHPVRRAILDEVAEADKSVVELAGSHTISLNAISKHIKKLEAAGLIRRRLDGSYHRISMDRDAMKVALRWMTHYVPFWNENLQSLKASLENRG
jgi:DNA-binding transcriptional ArsR family regulator